LVGVAVYVTGLPRQDGFAEAAIDTLTGSMGLTVMMMALEVDWVPKLHGSLDVTTQVITSPETGTQE
jgi:hypothetical protein